MKINEYKLYKKENNHPCLQICKSYEYETDICKTPYDFATLMVDMYDMNCLFIEYSYVIGLDYSNQVLGIVELSHETDYQTPTPLKELFMSLLLMGANKFVLLHNHPNNAMEASISDIELGKKVMQGANLLGLKFEDQIIIGYEDYLSMKQENLM